MSDIIPIKDKTTVHAVSERWLFVYNNKKKKEERERY